MAEPLYAGKTILVSLAHPDDESFGMGGTIAHYTQRGADVYLICATRGESGDVADEYMEGYASKAEVREAELACAAQHLGFKDVFYLNYRDSGMEGTPDNENPECFWAAPLDEAAERIVRYIRELKPDVVVTFDPSGGYLHPDHIQSHRATKKAFLAANTDQFPSAGAPFQPAALYYGVFPMTALRVMVRVLRLFGKDATKFGRNKDIDLERLARIEDYPQHVKLSYDGAALAAKEAASACHASQLSPGQNGFSVMGTLRRLFGNADTFTRAYPETPDDHRGNDLFNL
jgi:LmbE family N-acetylglucosaminyl deacetylase